MSFQKFFLFLLLILLWGCSKKRTEPIIPAGNQIDEGHLTGSYLSKTLAKAIGVDEKVIKYDSSKALFVIDGDLLLSKKDAEKYIERHNNPKEEHYRYNILVNNTYIDNIKVFIRPEVPVDWKTATQTAMIHWNTVKGSKIQFTEVTNSSIADITVKIHYAPDSIVAWAYYPLSNGRPGDTVSINTKYNGFIYEKKLFAMVHELGHTFALMHTNVAPGRYGTFINGTPVKDANSVMNSTVLAWQGLTAGDIFAVQQLYPGLNRIGMINNANAALVNEGSMDAEFKQQRPNATHLAIFGTRIGVIDNGVALVKEGPLNATWTQQRINVRSLLLSGTRIGVIDNNGVAFVKEGALNAVWRQIRTGVRSLVLCGNRIGIIDATGTALVKEGPIEAPWVTLGSNVKSIAMGGSRIGIINAAGTALVKEGPLNAPFTTQKQYVKSIALTASRIATVDNGNVLYVKEGRLSAVWTTQRSNVNSIAMAGNRFGIIDYNGACLIKEGALNSTWIQKGNTMQSLVLSN